MFTDFSVSKIHKGKVMAYDCYPDDTLALLPKPQVESKPDWQLLASLLQDQYISHKGY